MRFAQYSLMVFGHARIPIMGWMREQAQQSLAHAIQAGEEVTALGGSVSLGIGELSVPTTRPSTTSSKRCWSKSAEALGCTVSYSRWPKDAASRSKSRPVR